MKFLSHFAVVSSLAVVFAGCNSESPNLSTNNYSTTAAPPLKAVQPTDITPNHRPVTIDGSEVENSDSGTYIYKKISWNTSGGGDLHFSIENTMGATPAFEIRITQESFRQSTKEFQMTADAGPLFKNLRALFMGTLALDSHPPSPGMMTGTWSSVTLTTISGSEKTLESPSVTTPGTENLFQDLYSYVKSASTTAIPATSTVDCTAFEDLTGVWKAKFEKGTSTSTTSSSMNKEKSEDGALHYSGIDNTTEEGCFGGTSKKTLVNYIYHPETCVLTQVTEAGVSSAYKVSQIIKKGNSTRMFLQSCTDQTCAQTSGEILTWSRK